MVWYWDNGCGRHACVHMYTSSRKAGLTCPERDGGGRKRLLTERQGVEEKWSGIPIWVMWNRTEKYGLWKDDGCGRHACVHMYTSNRRASLTCPERDGGRKKLFRESSGSRRKKVLCYRYDGCGRLVCVHMWLGGDQRKWPPIYFALIGPKYDNKIACRRIREKNYF